MAIYNVVAISCSFPTATLVKIYLSVEIPIELIFLHLFANQNLLWLGADKSQIPNVVCATHFRTFAASG